MMNGYELADEIKQQIKDDMPTKIEENWLRKIQTMLRQQADQIAELERELSIMEGEYPEPTVFAKIIEFNSLEEAYNRIAELEKEKWLIEIQAKQQALKQIIDWLTIEHDTLACTSYPMRRTK